jgi:hypothetical protein
LGRRDLINMVGIEEGTWPENAGRMLGIGTLNARSRNVVVTSLVLVDGVCPGDVEK